MSAAETQASRRHRWLLLGRCFCTSTERLVLWMGRLKLLFQIYIYIYIYGTSNQLLILLASFRSNYCYLNFPGSSYWGATDFLCNDTCAIQFYQNAHNQPGSAYFFSYEYLCNQTSWWEDTFAGAWKTVVKCGDGGDDVSSVSASLSATASDGSVVSSGTPTSSSILTPTAAATSTGTGSATSASGSTKGSSAVTALAPTSSVTSGAVRVRPPFVGFF